jgi:AraC family transcriptional activator of pobA
MIKPNLLTIRNITIVKDDQARDEDALSQLARYKKIYTDFGNEDVIDIVQGMIDLKFAIYRLEIALPYFNWSIPRSRQAFYSIVLIIKGAGEILVGDLHFPTKDYTLFIVPEKTIYSGHYHEGQCAGYLMNFGLDFFSNHTVAVRTVLQHRIFRHIITPCLYLEPKQGEVLALIFENIHKEFREGGDSYLEMMEIKMMELFIQLDRMFMSAGLVGAEIDHHIILEHFEDLVEANFRRERSVQYYAGLLHVHPNHLNYLVKKHSGSTAKENIIKRVISEAKHLLSNTRQPIKEIATMTGFSDPNNFSTFFQKHAGCSPVGYRASSK